MTFFDALKLWRASKAIQGGIMPVKKGFSTSEFTMALIGAIIPILNSYLGWKIPIEAVLSISAIVISYITSRTVVKRNGGTKPVETNNPK